MGVMITIVVLNRFLSDKKNWKNVKIYWGSKAILLRKDNKNIKDLNRKILIII